MALRILCITPETHPCLQHAKNSKITHNQRPEALSGDTCTSLYQVFGWRLDQLGGRLNVLGKLGRAQMEFGCSRITHTRALQNMQFLFPLNQHVCRAIALHIASIVLKTRPCLQHAECRKHFKTQPQRCCQAICICICIWLEVNVLGKLGRAQMEFGHTRQNSCTDPFAAVPVGRVGGAPV